jgi:hypothetical protein
MDFTTELAKFKEACIASHTRDTTVMLNSHQASPKTKCNDTARVMLDQQMAFDFVKM